MFARTVPIKERVVIKTSVYKKNLILPKIATTIFFKSPNLFL
jgi:hypothetical protein